MNIHGGSVLAPEVFRVRQSAVGAGCEEQGAIPFLATQLLRHVETLAQPYSSQLSW